jgi:hypothetical protein
MHGRYGHVDLSGNERKGIAVRISNNFHELPVSNVKMGNRVFPLGGGGYFRLLPFPLFKWGIHHILKRDHAYLFYMHPWEIDPGQPVVCEASAFYQFRHYTNLAKTRLKLSAMFERFKDARFVSCRQYLNELSDNAEE